MTTADILVTLRYNLLSGERGPICSNEDPMWRFPPDCIVNLRESLFRIDPELAEGAKRRTVGTHQ